MAREDAEEGRHRGEQAHSGAHVEGLHSGHVGQDTSAHGRKGTENEETTKEYQERIDGYAEAIRYFLDHPEAPLNPVTRAFVESVRDEMKTDESTGGQQSTLN